MIGTCSSSSCAIEITPCTDLVPECTAMEAIAAIVPVQVKQMCYDGMTTACPVVCQAVELASCDLLSIFWFNEPDLATETCNQGLYKFCPVTCGAPRCKVTNTTIPVG